MSRQPLLFDPLEDMEERAALLDESVDTAPMTNGRQQLRSNCVFCSKEIIFEAPSSGNQVQIKCPSCSKVGPYEVQAGATPTATAPVPPPMGAGVNALKRASPRCSGFLSVLLVMAWLLVTVMLACGTGLGFMLGKTVWWMGVPLSLLVIFNLLTAEAARRRGVGSGTSFSWSILFVVFGFITLATLTTFGVGGALGWNFGMVSGSKLAQDLCYTPGKCKHTLFNVGTNVEFNCGVSSRFDEPGEEKPPTSLGPDGLRCHDAQDCIVEGGVQVWQLENCQWTCDMSSSRNLCGGQEAEYVITANILLYTFLSLSAVVSLILVCLMPVVLCYASSLNTIQKARRQTELH